MLRRWALYVVWHYFWWNMMSKCLPHMTIQSKDTFKVQLGESVSFFFLWGGVTYRNMDEGLCTRSWKTHASPKAHPCMGDSSWKLETWSAPHSLQAARHGGESLFQLPQLVCSASLKVLVGLTAYKKLGRKEDIVSVRNFLKFLLFTF